jgi:hypothetical protein
MSLSVTWKMPDGPVVLNNTPLVALWAVGRLGGEDSARCGSDLLAKVST